MMKRLCVCMLLLLMIGCSSTSPEAEPTTATETGAEVEAVATEVEEEVEESAETETEETETEPEETDEPEEATSSATGVDSSTWLDAWIINSEGATSPVFDGIVVDVSEVYVQTVNGQDYQCIRSSGIPSYVTEVDEATMNYLSSRPKIDTDFENGTPDISVGDLVAFGEDIGFELDSGCTDVGDGYGYCPFGPACPTDQDKDWCFPLDPEPIADGEVCATGLNQMGVFVNGVSIFDWQDGNSYNGDGVWVNAAFEFEIYDLDICVGHSANGNYHHHSNPTCLGAQLGDDGSGHSPIYGFAADGYPIYGPYEAEDTLAQSCWVTRDYSANSATGCGEDGSRACVLVDQFDATQGVMDAESAGPTTDEFITSLSGNPILAVSGAYFQDFYYDPDCTAQGTEYLDEHNGHYSDELGYHYHTTLKELEDGSLGYAFPHYAGPTYYGVLQENAVASCSEFGGAGPMGPPPGGGRDGGY